jgi:hypothetical protein
LCFGRFDVDSTIIYAEDAAMSCNVAKILFCVAVFGMSESHVLMAGKDDADSCIELIREKCCNVVSLLEQHKYQIGGGFVLVVAAVLAHYSDVGIFTSQGQACAHALERWCDATMLSFDPRSGVPYELFDQFCGNLSALVNGACHNHPQAAFAALEGHDSCWYFQVDTRQCCRFRQTCFH